MWEGEEGEAGGSIRKASIVSVMESNWRASEDAWSRVPLVRGLGRTPFRMGDAAGGILWDNMIFICLLSARMARFNRAPLSGRFIPPKTNKKERRMR